MLGLGRHLLVVLCGVIKVTVCLEIVEGYYFNKASPPVYKFDTDIIETVQTRTLTQCVYRCARDPICKSLAFKEFDGDPRKCWATASHKDYTGTWNHTLTGIPCQRWDSQTPHAHTRMMPEFEFPDATMADAANYCRNPESTFRLWCYTMDPAVRWDKCNVYSCFQYNCRLYNRDTSFYGPEVGEQPGIIFYDKST